MALRDLTESEALVDSQASPLRSQEVAENEGYDFDVVFKVKKDKAKEWHKETGLEFRAIKVQLELLRLFQAADSTELHFENSCVRACFEKMRAMEFSMFLTANHRGQYYHFWCAHTEILLTEIQKENEIISKRANIRKDASVPRSLEETQIVYDMSNLVLSRCLNLKGRKQKENWSADRYSNVLERVENKMLKRFHMNISKYLIPLLSQDTASNDTEVRPDSHSNFEVNDQVPKQIHGEHETLYLEAKLDVEKIIEECPKKHGHTHLIPVKDFTTEHLPKRCRSDDMFKFIEYIANLTVLIEVHATSSDRPKCRPHSDISYPMSDAPKDRARRGTGRIGEVYKYSSTKSHFSKFKFCPCEKCKVSGNPSQEWAEIFMFTAAHIVFDLFEVRNTRCVLFYDSKDSEVVVVNGVSVVEVDVERDWCRFTCVSCDMHLANQLKKILSSFFKSWYKIYRRFRTDADRHRLTIIVSHPHGGVKQVSLGKWKERHDMGIRFHSQYSYSNSTCPGSSGATVYFVGVSAGNGSVFDHHHHLGRAKDCSLNLSGVGWENEY